MRLIHLTDPHLSSLQGLRFMELRGKRRSGYLSWYKKRRFVHRPEILEHLTQAVTAESPDQLLVTGDLVHIGLEREMAEALTWLRRLGPPEKVMLIPGNHDNYARDSSANMYRCWGDYLPAQVGNKPDYSADYSAGYPVHIERDGLDLLGVNSSSVTRIFSATGELGREQQSRLARMLQRAPDDRRFQCLLIHHPPLPKMTQRRKALRDARQLQIKLEENSPDLILYGHLHRNREHLSGDCHIYCTASASSVNNASYRVFDLEQDAQGWNCQMRLMTLDTADETNSVFRLAAESSWSKTF